jgi:phage-related protein
MANDPVEELHNYMQTVAAVGDRLQHAGDQLEAEEKAFDELEDQLETHGEGFYKDVREFSEHLGQEGQQAAHEVETLAQYLTGDGLHALEEGVQAVDEEEEAVQQLAQQAEERLHSAHNDLQEHGFEFVRAGHEELTQSVHELESTTQEAFSELLHGIGGLVTTVGTVHTETIQHFASTTQHVTGHLTDLVSSTFSDMKSAVESTATNAVQTAFGELESEFGHVFQSFGGTAEEIGSHLMETGGQIFQDMVSHTEQHAVDAIKTEVEKAIEEVISGLLEEFAESIAMMGVGAATTTGLAPFVPELVIAKNVAKVVNEIIEALTFGLG